MLDHSAHMPERTEANERALKISGVHQWQWSPTPHMLPRLGRIWPLYHFAKDFGREATGQDVEDFGGEWYLVTPQGEKVGHRKEGTG
jgi:hypothetical protein